MQAITQDPSRWPFLHDLAEIMPVTDLAFGGAMLIVVVLGVGLTVFGLAAR